MRRVLRLLRRGALGDERMLARQADARRWRPSLALLRRFEREFGVRTGSGDIVFGCLTDPRARGGVGLARERLREAHVVFSGATGTGKTTAAMNITREMLRADDVQLINIDPKGDTSAALEAFVQERESASGGATTAREVKFVRPFDPNVIPWLRLTAPEDGVPTEITALGLVAGLEEATGGELGLRMRSILTPLATLAIELELPLSSVVRWLADPRAFLQASGGSQSPRLREYARSQFPRESRESISAIRSRLENLLLLPVLRRATEASRFYPLTEWIEKYHLNFDWSRPPAGQEAAVRALAAPVLGRLTRALMNRPVSAASPHIWLLADELPELLGRFETVGFARILAQVRSRGVSCLLLLQQKGQIPRDLQELIRTNCSIELVFRPNHRDAVGYAHSLPVADDEPNVAALRAAMVRRLERLPRRQFLWLVKDHAGPGQFVEAPEIQIPRLDPSRARITSCGDPAAPDAESLAVAGAPAHIPDDPQSPEGPGEFPSLG